jgi:hypothetical protein
MDPDQDIYCSKEPSVVHGSQPPGRRRGTGGRTAVQERFTGLTSRGVDKPAAPPHNRSSATPSTGPGESLLRADVAGGQRRRGGGEAGCAPASGSATSRPTQHDRMRRRLQGQPDHVADSGLQLRVAGEPEGLGLPGSAVVLGPPPRDRAVADSQLVGQQPT